MDWVVGVMLAGGQKCGITLTAANLAKRGIKCSNDCS